MLRSGAALAPLRTDLPTVPLFRLAVLVAELLGLAFVFAGLHQKPPSTSLRARSLTFARTAYAQDVNRLAPSQASSRAVKRSTGAPLRKLTQAGQGPLFTRLASVLAALAAPRPPAGASVRASHQNCTARGINQRNSQLYVAYHSVCYLYLVSFPSCIRLVVNTQYQFAARKLLTSQIPRFRFNINEKELRYRSDPFQINRRPGMYYSSPERHIVVALNSIPIGKITVAAELQSPIMLTAARG